MSVVPSNVVSVSVSPSSETSPPPPSIALAPAIAQLDDDAFSRPTDSSTEPGTVAAGSPGNDAMLSTLAAGISRVDDDKGDQPNPALNGSLHDLSQQSSPSPSPQRLGQHVDEKKRAKQQQQRAAVSTTAAAPAASYVPVPTGDRATTASTSPAETRTDSAGGGVSASMRKKSRKVHRLRVLAWSLFMATLLRNR